MNQKQKIAVMMIVACMLGMTRLLAVTWDGNGDANNSGNWSTANNWNPDGTPGGTTVVVLPDVTTGTRTITIDGNQQFQTLTLSQSTADSTNRVLFAGNLTTPCCGAGNSVTLTLSGGGIVLDKASYNLIFGNSTSLTLPVGTILNSTGGQVGRNWNGGSAGNILNQGVINLSAATTTFMADNTSPNDVFTNQGAINLTSGGGMYLTGGGGKAGNTFVNQGTLTGDGSGTGVAALTVRLLPGTQLSGVPTITANTFDLQATDHTAVNLASTTLQTINAYGQTGGLRSIEVGSNLNGRFLIDKLTVNSGAGANRTVLVDNYDNDLSSAAAEHLEVNTLEWAGSNFSELDLNGLGLKVNTAVALSPYMRQLSNRKAGSTGTVTLGGAVDLGSIMNNDFNGGLSLLVKNGATLDIVQNVSLSYLNVEAGSGTIQVHSGASTASNGGIHEYSPNGNYWNPADSLTVDLAGGTLTLNSLASVHVASGAVLRVVGNIHGVSAGGGGGRGVVSGSSGSRLEITGNITDGGFGIRTEIASGATLKLGGSFLPTGWWNGWTGTPNNFWAIDTSSTPGEFTFNGGGPSVQNFELVSKDYALSGGGLEILYSGSVTRAPFGTVNIGDPSGSPAWVKLVNNVNNNQGGGPNQDTQVARNLAVTDGSLLDLNGYRMLVALGNATVSGTITSTASAITAKLELAEGADLAFGSGRIDLLRNGSLVAGNNSIVDLSTGSLAVSNLTLSGNAALDWFAAMGGHLYLHDNQTNQVWSWVGSNTLRATGGDMARLMVLYDGPGNLTEVFFIPEPGTLLLLALGGLLLRRRLRAEGRGPKAEG